MTAHFMERSEHKVLPELIPPSVTKFSKRILSHFARWENPPISNPPLPPPMKKAVAVSNRFMSLAGTMGFEPTIT